jgi:hypothetical protein
VARLVLWLAVVLAARLVALAVWPVAWLVLLAALVMPRLVLPVVRAASGAGNSRTPRHSRTP